jgi:hypothetical protein
MPLCFANTRAKFQIDNLQLECKGRGLLHIGGLLIKLGIDSIRLSNNEVLGFRNVDSKGLLPLLGCVYIATQGKTHLQIIKIRLGNLEESLEFGEPGAIDLGDCAFGFFFLDQNGGVIVVASLALLAVKLSRSLVGLVHFSDPREGCGCADHRDIVIVIKNKRICSCAGSGAHNEWLLQVQFTRSSLMK